MGLGHVAATDQYMTAGAELYDLPLAYQAGDLNGPEQGRPAGRLRPPAARQPPARPSSRMPVPVATTLD